MLEFLARDVAGAKSGNAVIGFSITERDDPAWPRGDCTRVASLKGVYLPDELPDLYPADCPREDYCCCISIVSILDCDVTEEGRKIRARMIERGLQAPPPAKTYEEELAEIEALEQKRFADNPEGLKEHRSLVRKIVDLVLRR